jgi:CheY-like chemotaxis protein
MTAKKSKALQILVADDSKVSRQLALNLLKDLQHEVVVATTGKQAVKAVQDQSLTRRPWTPRPAGFIDEVD